MHDEILSAEQKSALAVLAERKPPALEPFYLAGGTALALHLGHRESLDFDFFQEQSFDPQTLLKQLPTPPPVKVLQADRDTLTVEFRRVKMRFFGYPHPLIRPLVQSRFTFPLASIPDIAAMKLAAIAGRGARKDFADVYFFCKQCFSLREAFTCLQTKFTQQQYDLYHILRSVTYFEDAESEPMPRMHDDVKWEQMKQFFVSEAARLRL
jgi:hypothetical protein